MGFLDRYRTHESATKAQAVNLKRYIEGRVADLELTSWTVLLASNTTGTNGTLLVDGLPIGRALRSPDGIEKGQPVEGKYDIGRLVDPPDELVDLAPSQVQEALAATLERWERNRRPDATDADRPRIPRGPDIRSVREPEKGLLLLYALEPPEGTDGTEAVMGFAFSFPGSRFDSAVDYWVNQVYLQQEFQWDA